MKIQHRSSGMGVTSMSETHTSTPQKRIKTAGIIGGLGLESTGLFYKAVNQYCLKKKLSTYPRLIINSVNTWAVTEILSKKDMQGLLHFLCQEISLIQEQVDFVAMACNSVHAVLEPLRCKVRVPIVSICEVVSKAVVRSGIKKVGIIGTTTTLNNCFYQQELTRRGLTFATLPPERESEIDSLIFKKVLYGQGGIQMQELLLQSVSDLRAQGCEGVIMACTELPLFIRQEDVAIPLFLSTQLLAEAVVVECDV